MQDDDDVTFLKDPTVWPGRICCVKRTRPDDYPPSERFGHIQANNGISLPRVLTKGGTSYHYDSIEELVAAGWIVD